MAELRYTYLLDVKDRASRQIRAANEQIARSATVANRALEKQGAVAAASSRRVQTAGARQAAEWKQVARAAQVAERSVAQAATQASTAVSRATERQIAAQRKAGASYAQIARQQKAAGASAAQTAAAIERSAAREQKAMAGRTKSAKGLSAIAGSFKGFAGIALAAGGVSVLTKALTDSVAEGTEAVKAHAQTVAALKSTGGAANVTAKQIENLSTAISNQVGIDDEAIQGAENLLLTFTKVRNETGKGNDVFNRATRTIVDMSVALKTPLKNASILVGKALQDPIRGLTSLRRVGVSFTDQQRAQIKALVQSGRQMEAQKVILRELNREFGGSARAAATPMQKLGVVIKNLEESLGRALLPVLNRAANAISKFAIQMQTGRGAGGQFAKTVSQVWTAAKGLAVALAPAAKAMASAFGPAARVARTAIGGMLQTIRGITGVVKGVVTVASRLIHGDFAGAWRAVKGIVRSALSGLGGLVKTLMAPVYTFAASAVRSAIRAMGRLGGGIAGALKGAARGVAGAASSVAGGVLNVFRTLARLVAGVWDGIVRTIRGAFSKVKGAIDTITSLPAKGFNAIFGRAGGVAHPGGFRRYQDGGVVPAMVSPGEMIVHQGRVGIVPGAPVAADNVAMMLPVGAAVLTGDGQRMVSQGATIGQAIAHQAPHYATGGWVRTGATVYNDPPPGAFGSLSGGYAELGTATRGGAGTGRGYIARALGMKGELPANFALDVKIHGRTKRLRKRDRGYGQGTPAYSIDIWKDSWSAFGINSSFKGPALIRPASGRAPSGRAPSTTGGRPAYSTYSPRGRLITSGRAMQLGYQAGLEGGSLYPVYASVRDAVTYNRTVHPAVAGRPTGSGGGSPAAGRGPDYGGRTGPMVTFQGKRMRSWLAHALAYARSKGWRGHVVEGLRSIAEQRRLWNGAPGNGLIRGVSVARPGTSNHQSGNAVDVAPAGAYLSRFFRGYRGHRPIWRGPTDRPHYSWNGHRRGGTIGARRFQGGGLVGPGSAVAPRDPLPRYQPGMPMTTGPSVVGPATLQSTRGALGRLVGVEMTAYQKTVRMVAAAQRALLKAGAHDNQAIATALHAIDVGIQRVHQVSYGRLERMAKQLKSAIATTKDPDTARRLKAELRLVFGEMGRRIGLLAKEAADMVDPAVRAAVHVERILKASKGRISLTTDAQIGALEKATQVGEDQLRAAIKKLQEAYRRAQKAGLKGAMHDLAGRIGDLMTQLAGVINDAKQAARDAISAAIQAGDDAKQAARDRAQRSFTAGQTIAGVDPASPEGLLAQYKFAGQQQAQMQQDDRTLRAWLAAASRDNNQDAVQRIMDALAENAVKQQEGLANMADLARQGQQAVQAAKDQAAQDAKDRADAAAQAAQDAADRAAQAAQDAADRREAERQAAIDAATGAVSLAQGGLQTLTLQQQLAGTYDQGGQARADYITNTIIPAIQREIQTMQARGASAQDIQQAQNDLLQEQLDAQEAIKGNTADTADALSKLGGTLGFEFQGARLTDDLVASGVGA